MKTSLFSCLFFIILSFSKVYSQPERLSSEVFERVLLQTDDDLYLAGESIHINILTIDCISKLPVEFSQVVYVELYSQNNIPLVQKKFPVKKGCAQGIIELPRTIETDIYYLRAYTNFMKNIGINSFYEKKIKLVNPFGQFARYQDVKKVYAPPYSLDLFSQFGTVLEGSQNNVICRFTDSKNRGIKAIAGIIDSGDSIIKQFRLDENGYGNFEFLPVAGETYSIELIFNDIIYKEIISIQASWAVRSKLIEHNDKFEIVINDTILFNYPLKLTVKNSAKEYTLIENILTPGSYFWKKKDLFYGYGNVSLIDAEGNILDNHMLLNKPFDIDIVADNKNYKSRDKIILKFSQEMLDTSTTFFYSVKNISGSLDNESINSEFSTFPLQQNFSDFPLFNQSRDSVLKLVYYPEIKYDIISGTVSNSDGNPVPNIKIIQSYLGKSLCVNSCITDSNGKFYLEQNNDTGNKLVLFNQNKEKLFYKIDPEFYPLFSEKPKRNFIPDSSEIETIKRRALYIQLSDVFDTLETLPQTPETNRFFGQNYIFFDTDKYLQLPALEEFLFDVVPNVKITKSNRKTEVHLISEITKTIVGNNPLFIIDGIPTNEARQILSIPLKYIESIRIIPERYYYKESVFDGIIDILTKKGDASVMTNSESVKISDFIGLEDDLSALRHEIPISKEIPYFKNLVLFEKITLNKNQSMFSDFFFAPDNKGVFLIECFGISKKGTIFYGSEKINVN